MLHVTVQRLDVIGRERVTCPWMISNTSPARIYCHPTSRLTNKSYMPNKTKGQWRLVCVGWYSGIFEIFVLHQALPNISCIFCYAFSFTLLFPAPIDVDPGSISIHSPQSAVRSEIDVAYIPRFPTMTKIGLSSRDSFNSAYYVHYIETLDVTLTVVRWSASFVFNGWTNQFVSSRCRQTRGHRPIDSQGPPLGW